MKQCEQEKGVKVLDLVAKCGVDLKQKASKSGTFK